MKQQLPNMEFGRRLAAERDLEKSEAFHLCNISKWVYYVPIISTSPLIWYLDMNVHFEFTVYKQAGKIKIFFDIYVCDD